MACAVIVLVLSSALLSGCLNELFNRHPKPWIALSGGGAPYGPAPWTLSFDISKSADPDGDLLTYAFDFGDGEEVVQGADVTEPIVHTYERPGSYIARLTLTDEHGATASLGIAVLVYAGESSD